MQEQRALFGHLRSKRGLFVLAIGLALVIGIFTTSPISTIALIVAATLGGALLILLSARVSILHHRVAQLEKATAGPAAPRVTAGLAEGARTLEQHPTVTTSGKAASPPSSLITAARHEEGVGTPQTALHMWRRALEETPENPEVVIGVARNLEKGARFSEALEILDRGPERARSMVDGLVVAGRALEKVGRLDESIQCWTEVVAQRPDHRDASRSLAAAKARKASGVVGRELDLSRDDDREIVDRIREALQQASAAGGGTPPDEEYLRRHSYMRYNRSIGNLVPWIGQHLDLGSSEIIEVGCGTGSTLVGLAMNAAHAYGYDIDQIVLDTCLVRAREFELDNVTLHLSPPDQIQAEMAGRHRTGVDAILLYAVLEHLTPGERLEAISNTWDLIRPGGLLIVVEAPNRFTYFDWHSTQLPFFHQLPRELQRLYFDRSPRSPYVRSMSQALASGGEAALDEALTRFGQSLSYHEFELALGPIDTLVIEDGDHPLVDRVFTRNELIGEDALRRFLKDWGVSVPRGFDRANINVILRKPATTGKGNPGTAQRM